MFSLSKLKGRSKMTTEEIKKEILSWEKWGYNFTTKEIVLFTSWVVDFNEKKEVFTTTYKPKAWIECNFKDFFFSFFKDKELRKNFRYHSSYFTEEEKATEEEIPIELNTSTKELFCEK